MHFRATFYGLLSLLPLSLVSASPVPSTVAQSTRRDDSSTITAQQIMNLMGAQEKLIEQYLPIAMQSFNSSDPTVEVIQGFLDVHKAEFGDLFDPALDQCTFDFFQIQTNDSENTVKSMVFVENLMTMTSLSFFNNATALGLSPSDVSVLQNMGNVSHALATVAGSMVGLDVNDTAAAISFGLVNIEAMQLILAGFRPNCPADLGLDALKPQGIQYTEMTTPFSPTSIGSVAGVGQRLSSQCPDPDSCSCQVISSVNGVLQSPLAQCRIGTKGTGLDMTIVTLGNDTLSSDPFTRALQVNSYVEILPPMFGAP